MDEFCEITSKVSEDATLQNDCGKRDESLDLDDLLPAIGEFGIYQKMLVFGICLPACIPCGFCAFNQIFMANVPNDYWCKVPDLLDMSVEKRKLLAIPKNVLSAPHIVRKIQLMEQVDWNGCFSPCSSNNRPQKYSTKLYEENLESYSKCYRYAVNWTGILEVNYYDIDKPNETWPYQKCDYGWEYNTSVVWSSIVIDFDLVCDKDIYPTIGLSALNVGGPIGVYLFGLLNDRMGRRVSYFSCLATLLLGSLITSLSKDFWTWAGSRVIVGLTIPAVYQIPFIISLELVGENYRSFVTVMTCTFYTSGIMLLSVVTYLERDWVKLSYYTSAPFHLYFAYIFVMPESPRWLLMRGRLQEALAILENMAKVNGQKFPEEIKANWEAKIVESKNSNENAVNVGVFDLFRTPNMRLKTILITLSWFANETVYLGLSYYGPSLGNDQYVSFFLSAAVELPSYMCCWYLMDTFGRRWPLSLSMILGGAACVVTVTIPDDATDETLILYLVSKALLSASFLIIYPFAGELYPTQVRGIGIGASSYIGGLGLIVIPFVTYLGRENLKLPLVIMGVISMLGGLTSLRLPETLHERLPQTLEEGENFGKEWSFKKCIQCYSKQKVKTESESYENLDLLASSDGHNKEPQKLKTNKRDPEGTSIKRLVRQMSVMDTQRNVDGTMQLTHWI